MKPCEVRLEGRPSRAPVLQALTCFKNPDAAKAFGVFPCFGVCTDLTDPEKADDFLLIFHHATLIDCRMTTHMDVK